MKNTLRAAFATVVLCSGLIGISACATGSSGLGQRDVLVAEGLRLPRSHQYELYQRESSSYASVTVDTVPGYVKQGAWIHDRTAGAWVSHPSVGTPNPQYAASGGDVRRGGATSDRDVLVADGLRLPRSHQYELYNRDSSSYGSVTVDTVPGRVKQGAWIYDRTAGVWVAHPSVGSPNPQYSDRR
jgi:hypothetical protein